MEFKVNRTYLSSEEEGRLRQAAINQEFFDNSFDRVRKIYSTQAAINKEDADKWVQIAVAMPRLITKLSADMLFLEPPIITSKDEAAQKFIDEKYDAALKQRYYQAAIQQSIYGGVVIKVVAEENDPSFQFIPQFRYHPNFFIFTEKISDITLTDLEPSDKQGQAFLLVENYTPGELTSRIFLVDSKSNQIIRELSVEGELKRPSVEKTFEDVIPLFYVPILQESPKQLGISDYDGIESLFYALNRRLTHNEHTLEAHGGAKLAAPSNLFDQNGRLIKPSFEYFAMPPGSQVGSQPIKPEYIQQQLSVEQNIETIKEYLKLIFLTSEISPDIFGLGDGSGPESGTALRHKLLRTLTMITRKASTWQANIKASWDLALQVANISGEVSVKMQDGLPGDLTELIDQEIAKLDGGLQSQKEAVMRIDQKTEDEAAAKVEDIRTDNLEKSKAQGAAFRL